MNRKDSLRRANLRILFTSKRMVASVANLGYGVDVENRCRLLFLQTRELLSVPKTYNISLYNICK